MRAVSDVQLVRFTKDFFLETLLPNPVFHIELDKVLVERLRSTLHDQMETTFNQQQPFVQVENTDLYPFFEDGGRSGVELDDLAPRSLQNVQVGISKFADDLEPLVIIGESGTGRKSAAIQIHD